ncbi:MAG: 2-oxoacid:acceptor oxidoreductase subunit alpha [Chloroflexota bacterium]
MTVDVNFLVGGEAGQGVQSVGAVLVRTLASGGLHIFADQDYESRVRGGHNFFRVRVSDREIMALHEDLDVLIALNQETIDLHRRELKRGGFIIRDGEAGDKKAGDGRDFPVPLAQLAEKAAQNKLMTNTVAAGAALGLVDYDFDSLTGVLGKEFGHLGEKVVAGNVAAARAGYDYAREKRGNRKAPRLQPVKGAPRRMLLHGNEALSLGALAGGCRFISGYPMTPASSILEYLATQSKKYGVVAAHVEDEIAVANMAVGAAFTGARAMVATSGGGFALMVEALALAGITETPVVFVLAQRPGPATGLPTRTEQGELEFALHAGHGEFPRAVLAPATTEEAFHAAVKAFNLAEKYQTPVIILTDHHLATSYRTVTPFDLKKVQIDRGELLTDAALKKIKHYQRHRVTDSGISPRAFPGQGKALVVTDSDEHDAYGHMIEDAETRIAQDLKRLRKLNGLRKEISPPRVRKVTKAEFTLVGWGSTYGAIREAAEALKEEGVGASTIHLSELYPFPAAAVAQALAGRTRKIVVEGNATAPLGRLIRRETGIKMDDSILRFDGRPLSPRYIVERLRKEVS